MSPHNPPPHPKASVEAYFRSSCSISILAGPIFLNPLQSKSIFQTSCRDGMILIKHTITGKRDVLWSGLSSLGEKSCKRGRLCSSPETQVYSIHSYMYICLTFIGFSLVAMAVVMTMTGARKLLAIFHLDSSPNMCLVFLTMLFALLPQLELFTDKFSLSLDSIGITNPTKQG